jgi:3-deoxy-D-manno-octulosonate 8-phosphate phosphatase KdsC-like HAD superfamily phosphatase
MSVTIIPENGTQHMVLWRDNRLTVTAAIGGSAIVERYRHGDLVDKTLVASGETKILGEYFADYAFNITCLEGSVSYSAAQSTAARVTHTNDNASAGEIGEYISSTIAAGAAVALTSDEVADVTSIELTAGDWDVSGVVGFKPAASTSVTYMAASSSLVTATSGGNGAVAGSACAAVVPGASAELSTVIPVRRVSVAVATTVYLTALATFTVSTLGAYGVLRARRVR